MRPRPPSLFAVAIAIVVAVVQLATTGAAPAAVAEDAGLQVGGALPKGGMAVRASAADGFEAIFSCAELFESTGTTRAMIIWKVDGKPLAGDRGPLRLVVLTDKEPSRSIYGVRKLEVLDLRTPP